MFSLVILVLIFSLGGCYTRLSISSDELIKGGKKAVTGCGFEYNAARINVINAVPNRQFIVTIGSQSTEIPYKQYAYVDYNINLIPYGQTIRIPVIVMSGNLRVASREFCIYSQNNKPVTTWAIQVNGNQICLMGN